MASRATVPLASTQTNFKTFPRTSIRSLTDVVRPRWDQLGNEFSEKRQRVTFIDRMKGEPIHRVVEVEAIEYPNPSSKKRGCHCLLL